MGSHPVPISADKVLLTPKDRERLAPVVRGEYPSESAYAVVEIILREHLGAVLQKDL